MRLGSLRFAHAGQAMVETLLAVLVISFSFFFLFRLSRVLTTKIIVQYAAMRVARARAVGFNEFMCLKSARVAVIPVAGERVWPTGDDAISTDEELSRLGIYMQTTCPATARGVLEYEGWSRLTVDAGDGTCSKVRLSDDIDLTGEAGIERQAPFYLEDAGL